MNAADEKLLEKFETRHAGKSEDELVRLARKELPADLLTRLSVEELALNKRAASTNTNYDPPAG